MLIYEYPLYLKFRQVNIICLNKNLITVRVYLLLYLYNTRIVSLSCIFLYRNHWFSTRGRHQRGHHPGGDRCRDCVLVLPERYDLGLTTTPFLTHWIISLVGSYLDVGVVFDIGHNYWSAQVTCLWSVCHLCKY